MTMLFFFFFQAEDGIRDLVRSRGLGDVYKRQSLRRIAMQDGNCFAAWKLLCSTEMALQYRNGFAAVSYTHLTLPTSDLV